MKHSLIAAAALSVLATPHLASAQEPRCEIDRPILFAGLDWQSPVFHNAVARYILEEGYGCETDEILGSALPMITGMARGDVDVTMEIWRENYQEAWDEVVDAGSVVSLGINFPDSEQGWYVPRYVVEGENAEAPDLKSVEDLPQYKDVFRDPEEPNKGRFYNGVYGWGLEVISTKKLHAYGLTDDYTNFRPGTDAARAAAIARAFAREQPIFAFAWSPSLVMGRFDLVRIEEPPYDPEIWAAMEAADDPEDVEQATAFPDIPVYIGANKEFTEEAPQIAEFLTNYETTSDIVSAGLVYMDEHEDEGAEGAAKNFLREHEDLWSNWVPEDVAERVRQSL